MGLTAKILSKIGYEKRSGTANPAQWLIDWVRGGGPTASGVNVSAQSALKFTPFWACVRIISGTVGALPFLTYKHATGGGKDRQPNHRVYKLLHDRPNPHMDALTFIETRQAHVLNYGNGYAEIQRDGGGRPVALWPLLPNMTQRKMGDDGTPYYLVRLPKGGGEVRLADENVLHIKGLGFDGYTGYNVVAFHKEALGYGIAVKEYGARFFANDASPGGVLEHPGLTPLSDKARANLKASWGRDHGSLKNSHRMQLLEEGIKWKQTGVDPAQAQALETQKLTIDDCARIFQIPPHKIGSMEFSKFNNVEHLQIEFHTATMLYWYRKWELECNYKLFMPAERGKYFCQLLVDGLLRGDIKTRYAAYNIGRTAGFLCVDDIREWENLNPLPDGKGKIFLEPLNMKPAGTDDPVDPKPEPDDDDDNNRAHRDLIVDVFKRVVAKYQKTGHKRGSRAWAIDIMAAPVAAYASIHQTNLVATRKILSRVVDEFVREGVELEDKHAEEFTNRIITELGGNNHAAQTK